jgi:hypothetical protein
LITIHLKRTMIVMAAVITCLTVVDIVLGSIGIFDRSRAGVTENYHRLLHFFDLAAEANAPTWFKSAMFGRNGTPGIPQHGTGPSSP